MSRIQHIRHMDWKGKGGNPRAMQIANLHGNIPKLMSSELSQIFCFIFGSPRFSFCLSTVVK